ncbi:MAG: carbohydrate kinase [Planctomycetota bacterium]|nr:carbohydrate kinase [Planctomycetota bacterium]
MQPVYNVTAVGEILWDLFPERTCFGGAPANFACAASQLGADSVEVTLLSGVGGDALGRKAVEQLANHGVSTRLLQTGEKCTGRVEIELNPDGSAVYRFAEDVAWDNLVMEERLYKVAAEADAVCFGTLGQRSARSAKVIQEFLAHTSQQCVRIFDINLRFPHVVATTIEPSLQLCNVLKLNDDELPWLADFLGLRGNQSGWLQQLQSRYALDWIALTRGSQGALLVSGQQQVEIEPLSPAVVDTVGAGDAFTAVLAMGILGQAEQWSRDSIRKVGELANRVASFVCTQSGATPNLPKEFSAEVINLFPVKRS